MRDNSKYFLYGETPVKFESTPAGELCVLVFDIQKQEFVADSTYWSQVMYDRDNLTRKIDEAEFARQITRLTSSSGLRKFSKVRKQLPLESRHRLKRLQ
jgi:hypothetical protein